MLNFSTDIILLSFDKMKDITLMDSIFEKNKRTCVDKISRVFNYWSVYGALTVNY